MKLLVTIFSWHVKSNGVVSYFIKKVANNILFFYIGKFEIEKSIDNYKFSFAPKWISL